MTDTPTTVALTAAAAAVDRASEVVAVATEHLARAATVDGRISVARLDEHQVLGYDLAHAASAVEGAKVMLDYGDRGEVESLLARAFIADAVADLGAKLLGREGVWGVDVSVLADAWPFVEEHRSPEFLESVAATLERTGTGPSHLPDDFQLAADTFHRFAEDKIRPVAEHVHRANADVPEDLIERPRRARRLRPVGPRGVRWVRERRRGRLPRHGGRHRGALLGIAGRRRLAHHPPRDPHPRHRRRAAPTSRSGGGCRASPRAS